MNNPWNDELISAYLDGELTAEEQAQVEQALASDSRLRQMHDDLRALRHSLQSMPRVKLGDDFAARVLAQAQQAKAAADKSSAELTHIPPAVVAPANHTSAKSTSVKPVVPSFQTPSASSITPAKSGEPLAWKALVWGVAGIAAAVLCVLMLPGEMANLAQRTPSDVAPALAKSVSESQGAESTKLDSAKEAGGKEAGSKGAAAKGNQIADNKFTDNQGTEAGDRASRFANGGQGGGGIGGGGLGGSRQSGGDKYGIETNRAGGFPVREKDARSQGDAANGASEFKMQSAAPLRNTKEMQLEKRVALPREANGNAGSEGDAPSGKIPEPTGPLNQIAPKTMRTGPQMMRVAPGASARDGNVVGEETAESLAKKEATERYFHEGVAANGDRLMVVVVHVPAEALRDRQIDATLARRGITIEEDAVGNGRTLKKTADMDKLLADEPKDAALAEKPSPKPEAKPSAIATEGAQALAANPSSQADADQIDKLSKQRELELAASAAARQAGGDVDLLYLEASPESMAAMVEELREQPGFDVKLAENEAEGGAAGAEKGRMKQGRANLLAPANVLEQTNPVGTPADAPPPPPAPAPRPAPAPLAGAVDPESKPAGSLPAAPRSGVSELEAVPQAPGIVGGRGGGAGRGRLEQPEERKAADTKRSERLAMPESGRARRLHLPGFGDREQESLERRVEERAKKAEAFADKKPEERSTTEEKPGKVAGSVEEANAAKTKATTAGAPTPDTRLDEAAGKSFGAKADGAEMRRATADAGRGKVRVLIVIQAAAEKE